MTTSNHHVFLPPKLLPLSSFKADSGQGLVFHDLPRISSSSQAPPRSQPVHYQDAPPIEIDNSAEVADEVESWDDSLVMSKLPAKRRLEDVEDSLSALPAQFAQPRVSVSRALGPRRSARFSRTSDLGIDGTESFMSLNTTLSNSQPSQPPLPNWSIPLSRLVSLQFLLSRPTRPQQGNSKLSLMVCVMAVETLQQLQRKEEKAAGREGTLWIAEWKVTSPPFEGQNGKDGEVGCSVKLWDKMASEWGGGCVRRGDVVLLENVEYKSATARDPPTISVSSGNTSLQPKVTILYRTLVRRVAGRADYLPPRNRGKFGQMLAPPVETSRMLPEDEALRPDLRLSRSDAGVRRVMEWAEWFANWVGGDPP